MADTAAYLGTLLSTNEKIAECTRAQMYWSQKLDLNMTKLKDQQKYETKWNSAYDSAMDSGRTKDLKCGSVVAKVDCCEAEAARYANAKSPKFDQELLDEYTDLDVEYDSMKTMYETLLEKLRADKEAQKELTSNAAQDTGLMQS